MLLGPAMDASERQATLELLAAAGAPFRPLALEQRALMHLDAGDKAAAIADLQAVLAEPPATRGAARPGAAADHRGGRHAAGAAPAAVRPTADGRRRWSPRPARRASALALARGAGGLRRARTRPLPGERIPVRAEDAPVAGGSRHRRWRCRRRW